MKLFRPRTQEPRKNPAPRLCLAFGVLVTALVAVIAVPHMTSATDVWTDTTNATFHDAANFIHNSGIGPEDADPSTEGLQFKGNLFTNRQRQALWIWRAFGHDPGTPGAKLANGSVADAHLAEGYWKRNGNAGTTAGTDFLGTTDDEPLEIKVFGARALRLERNGTSPNLIGGFGGNNAFGGVLGATIGGGGAFALTNLVTDDYGTVGGGWNNRAGDGGGTTGDRTFATVGGGESNTASGLHSTVGGGSTNDATGTDATVAGGFSNTAAGTRSFAAGRLAKANHDGAFVWADNNPFAFASTAINEFSARAVGGLRFVTAIGGGGAPIAGIEVEAGASALDTIGGGAMDLKVNNARALRLEPNATSPNVFLGWNENGHGGWNPVGATIGGGGASLTRTWCRTTTALWPVAGKTAPATWPARRPITPTPASAAASTTSQAV